MSGYAAVSTTQMLDKRCFTIEPCSLQLDCALSSTPQSMTRQYFQPQRVGEHCDHFTMRHNWRKEDEEND